ncbi:unnamed protein product (macronuclear) [Paramecium tetraurelia]|uniref:adenylate cyclase n=1 Tax=Paramecium tetraurelia TaxID=5888 RepID=A0DTD8_PARTE|nr:uncharacterized protein GSPATT00019986001 [Paramecium tetraurelia]CAK86305.1 unnamed protein product [Paramecium tetraurelia]|eukprot:XP_001453702.1 hypothetical protein (macronuclear) [Paramecium tetraurelia strain d4-2]
MSNSKERLIKCNIHPQFQLHFRKGEVIRLDGYSTYSNRINRTSSILSIVVFAPFRIARNNIIYITLSIISLIILASIWSMQLSQYCRDSPQYEFYFIFSFQILAHISVELYNKFKINGLDNKLNNQENKILKQWDECISNKEILKRIKQKASQKPKNDEIKEKDRVIQIMNDQLQRQQSWKSRSSVQSQFSRQSINQGRPAGSPRQDRMDRMGSRVSMMSPLIHEDMIIKNELKIKFVQDPAIRKFMQQVPCIFEKNTSRSKKIIDLKAANTADKIDLIKSITAAEIKIGDVIIVERNQIASCDILVLYCNDENFAISNQLCEYSNTTIRKPLVQNKFDSHNLVLFKKSFTGNIQLNENANNISGYFQLKKDPQSKVIEDQNFIFAQEKLLNTPWVIGIVIQVGLNCRCYKQFKIKPQVPNYSSRLIMSMILLYFAFLISMYIITYQNRFVNKYQDMISYLVQDLVYLLFLLPHSFKLYYDLIQIFQQRIINKISQLEIKQIKAFHPEYYQQYKRLTMNLDSLLEGTFELRAIICNQRICHCREHDLMMQAQVYATSISSQNIFKSADSKDESKIVDIQASYTNQNQNTKLQNNSQNSGRYLEDEIFSYEAQEEMVLNIPQSVGFRLISNFTINDNTQQECNGLIQHQSINPDKSEYQAKSSTNKVHLSMQSKSVRQMTLKDSRYDKKSVLLNDIIKIIISEGEIYNVILLQLAMNHISYSKLTYGQTGEEKVKNTQVNLLDEKQIYIAKAFGFEFICVNNVQNISAYVVQINQKLYSFKLIDFQIHHHTQRLYMLFELDPDFEKPLNAEYILLVREANYKKSDSQDENKLSQKSSINFFSQVDLEQLHQIHYYSCLLNHEDAAYYVNQQQLQYQNTYESEEFIYSYLEPFLQFNITLGFKYNLKPKAQEFIRNFEKSELSLFFYTEQHFSYAYSTIQQTDIQTHFKLIFDQENDDDLKAYLKKSLSQFTQLFSEQNNVSNSQVQSFNKLVNPISSQLSNKKVQEDLNTTTPITIMLNSQACKIIENSNYMANHMKLLFSLSKVILLYGANNKSLNFIQNLFDEPNLTLNLIFENQTLLKCHLGQHLQIALLQEFSYFQKVKYENINKQTFFKNMIQSLKVRLIYERCLFNELLIYHNSDAILQGFNELNDLLFYQVPLLNILTKYQFLIAFQRTMYFSSFAITVYITTVWFFNNQKNLILEFLFYSYVYSLIIYIVTSIQFIKQQGLNTKRDQYQLKIIKSIINQSKNKSYYIQIGIKSIIQGIMTQLIFIYQSQIQSVDVVIVYCFLSITLNDLISLLLQIGYQLKVAAFIIYSLSYLFYLLIHFNIVAQSIEFKFEITNLFEILLVIFVFQVSESFFQHLFVLQLPEMKELFQKIANSITHQKESINKKQTQILNLQREINKIFENIEQVDFNLQKLLLSQKQLFQNLGQWQSQIFQKAQSIMKWKNKSRIQGLQLIFFHCQMLIIIYSQSATSYYFLITYIVYQIFLIVIFVFQLLYHLNSRQMQYLELVKYMMSGIATFMAVFGLSITEMSSYYHTFSEIIVTFQISSKLHPIYDNRLYLIPIIIVLIAYFVIFLLNVDISPYFVIFKISIILFFSIQQYIIKSYVININIQFILLEEDQATNQINFIEENNKINDILGILLPKFVRHRLNETDQYNIHQNQGNVAIVFCDICNFDQIIMEEQENIISFLDDLFRTFDKYCEICGVQKIETVGKTYMAAAGLKACEQELAYLSEIQPVQRALNLAEMMITYIRSKLWGHQSQPLIGKIGIHYGRAISGVIGFHKPQFSLIGDTVNTTSRVCSTGQEDRIILSEKAFEQLKNEKIEFEVRYVEMKGLGQRPTYVYIQKGNTKNYIAKNSMNNSNSRQNTINVANRVRTQSFQKGGLKKRSIAIQDNLNQRSKQLLQFQLSWNFQQQNAQQNSQSLSEENSIKNGLQNSLSLSNNNLNPLQKDHDHDDRLSRNIKKPELIQQLACVFHRKFHLEEYQPEVDHYIDYDQLLNVILLKNENGLEETLILQNSFLSLLKRSYNSNQNNYLEYHEYIYKQSEQVTNRIIQIYSFYYLIKQFCLIGEYNDISLPLIILQWIGCTLNIISLMIYKKRMIGYWVQLIYIGLSFQLIIAGVFVIVDMSLFLRYSHIIEMIFIQSFFSNIQLLHFWIKILFCICSFIFEAFVLIFSNEHRISLFFAFIVMIYNINYCYFLEEQQVACFNQKNIFQSQQAKESQLLQYLLPKHILQTFLDDNNRTRCLSDKIENVTILFADIAGFTEYSSKVTPEEVLLMLKNLFVEFDRKCYELNVYKLYTIGDCYVAFGMIDYNERNPTEEAKNIVDLAFEMIRIIEVVRKQINFDGLDMRIGIHTGCVLGGVMGTDIVRYDIYGPDVLIANKMESNGKKGQVHVSEITKQLLEQDYEDVYSFTLNTKVTLNAINKSIDGYIIENLAEDDFPSDQINSQQIQVQSLHSEH